MPFHFKNTGIPLYRILVLEPYDIAWLGIQNMIRTTLEDRVSMIRIRDTNALADAALHYRGDVVLVSAVAHHVGVLPLLHQLSVMHRYERTFHIAAYLRKDVPHLKELLLAFGVNRVFGEPMDPIGLTQYLMPTAVDHPGTRLTPQERNVAQALLTGKSVTRVAQLMHKDVRTISAHKQAVLGKLNMASRGELQVLGGRLMAGGVSA